MIEEYEHIKTREKTRYSGRLGNSCYTSGSHCITPAANPFISLGLEKEDGIVTTTIGTYLWLSMTLISDTVNQIMRATVKLLK